MESTPTSKRRRLTKSELQSPSSKISNAAEDKKSPEFANSKGCVANFTRDKRRSQEAAEADLNKIINDQSVYATKDDMLKALGIKYADASTQTEGYGREVKVHLPANGILSTLRKTRRRSRSSDSPAKKTSRSSSKDAQSPTLKFSNRQSKINPDLAPNVIKCGLCTMPAVEFQLGPLYGPYKCEKEPDERAYSILGANGGATRKEKKSEAVAVDNLVWVHDTCAVWTPGVFLNETRLEGLESAISLAANTVRTGNRHIVTLCKVTSLNVKNSSCCISNF